MVHLFYIVAFGVVICGLSLKINHQRKLIKQFVGIIKDLELEKDKAIKERDNAQAELSNFIDTFDAGLAKEEEIREQVLQDFQNEVEAILLKDMMKRMKNVGEA
jgi:hypothetical protein